MAEHGPIAYLYDGTFEGMMCCVFESFRLKEAPCAIFSPDTFACTLYPVREIATDLDKHGRVYRSIRSKISSEAQELVTYGFLSCADGKELLILDFLRLGYRLGAKITDMLQDGTVCALQKAVRFLHNESHLLLGFLRFSECEEGLVSVITPKNSVLPLLLPHFAGRYPEETFMIYDKTHGMVLCYRPYEARILAAESVVFPPPSEREEMFRRLWKRFYNTVAVEGRYNPSCRQTHCPKRYWEHMVELSESQPGLCGAPAPALLEGPDGA